MRRWAQILAAFLTGQSLVQAIGAITGFLLLRWMSVESYAQYGVANAFQSTLSILVDMGFTSSIVGLVGARVQDKGVVGGYIKCARSYRGRLFIVMSIASLIAFPLIVRNQPWPWHVKSMLLGSVLLSIFFSAWNVYASPLLMHRHIKSYYMAQVVPAALRLTLSGIAHIASVLTGTVASWINAAATIVGGALLKKSSAGLFEEPAQPDPEKQAEMRRFLGPLWPGMIIGAFQTQITIALVSLFGKTQTIAEVTALGRLSQLLMLFGAAHSVLLVPKIARVSRERLPAVFLKTLGLWAGVMALLTAFAFQWPSILLWLLGPKYAGLRELIGWVVLATSIYFLAIVIGSINSARKWTFWTNAVLSSAITISTMCGWLFSRGLSTTQDAVFYQVTLSISAVACVALTSIRGFRLMPAWLSARWK